tara:strand:+ start:3468 stop:5342 length:1875 start_codon:yes stop_codon:yes gene_type:complete
MLQQTHTTANTGLQSFADASPDYELAPVGIASMQEQAQKLAEYGRNGDIYVVHAAEGETVVPMEVLNANPKVKELLFKQMEEMGMDPQEFIVGNDLNSINPDTGLPEFFFKSIFRAVKKAVKAVVKVVKKAAPIVLPIAAAAFGVPFLGPMFGAGTFGASFLGSGIGTLIGGGSFKDALKSGLISGGLAVGTSALSGAFKGNMSFSDSLQGSFTGSTPVYNPGGDIIGYNQAASPYALGSSPEAIASANASATQFGSIGSGDFVDAFTTDGSVFGDAATAQSPGFVGNSSYLGSIRPVSPAIPLAAPQPDLTAFGGSGSYVSNAPVNFSANPFDPATSVMSTPSTLSFDPAAADAVAAKSMNVLNPTYNVPANASGIVPYGAPAPNPSKVFGQTLSGSTTPLQSTAAAMNPASKAPSFLDTAGDYLFRGGSSKLDIAKDIASKEAAYLTKMASAGIKPSEAGLKAAAASAQPNLLQQYGPTLALGGAGAYALGAFDQEEQVDPTREDLAGFVPQETGYDLFQADPSKYRVEDLNPYRYDPGNPVVASRYVADGGYMENTDFPRREMLVEGPGTERSDDIPAMLSDGEFVYNAKAVRGADPTGQGDRYKGAKNLYNMMRNFEMRA